MAKRRHSRTFRTTQHRLLPQFSRAERRAGSLLITWAGSSAITTGPSNACALQIPTLHPQNAEQASTSAEMYRRKHAEASGAEAAAPQIFAHECGCVRLRHFHKVTRLRAGAATQHPHFLSILRSAPAIICILCGESLERRAASRQFE